MTFHWPGSFDPDYELRDWTTLAQTVQSKPHGVFWPLLGTRRSGKTWALEALEHKLGKTVAVHVKLNQIHPAKRKLSAQATERKILLFDEPGRHLFDNTPLDQLRSKGWQRNPASITKFLEWCRKLSDSGKIIVLALTPAEWDAVLLAGQADGLVNPKDLEYRRLGPLLPEQASLLPRTDKQRELFELLPLAWRRNPYLLVKIFSHALDAPGKHRSTPLTPDQIVKLQRDTIEELCSNPQGSYLHDVLDDCLLPAQREVLRSVARHRKTHDQDRLLLMRLGLLTETRPESGEYEIGDPVLADHFAPPVRIHHISDLHFGPNTAVTVDAKDKSEFGQKMAQAAGQGPVRDDYLDWLDQLDPHSRPHLVVVSGDIAEGGPDPLQQLEELEQGRAWLDRLFARLAPHPALGPADPRILLVPGNHDVDWSATDGSAGERRRHLPFARVFDGKGWPFPRLEHPATDREPAHQHYRSVGIAFALLGSPELGGSKHEKFGRLDPGLVHDEDIQRLRSDEWKHELVRIAVVHHPLSTNQSIATEISAYAGLSNGGQVMAALLEKGFSLLLHGHTHANHLELREKVILAGAGTLGSRGPYERHGFNEILVYREGELCNLRVESYERKDGSFKAGGHKELILGAE